MASTVVRTYIKCQDVMAILGCAETHAYKIIKDVNRYAVSKKLFEFPKGSANKYLFAERYGIPVSDVDSIILMIDERKED